MPIMYDTKNNNLIPLSEPEISGNEWKYIKECLDTGWISSVGSYVDRFEEVVASYVGSKHAVAVINGTSAIHASLIACDVQSNAEVIVPTLTFIAPVNAVRYCGAYPVFMDCDKETLCMDVQKVSDFITKECSLNSDGYTYNKKTGRKIKAIIPVHVFGHPVQLNALLEISERNNIRVIEDATGSLGSEYNGKRVGTLGEMGCLSFNGNKIITTGGGGMVLTDDDELAFKTRHLSTQAKKEDSIEYDHDEIGYNYRFSSLQASMGVAQMERLGEFVSIKRKNAYLYKEALSGVDAVEFIWEQSWAKSNFWFYTIRVPKEQKVSLMEYLLSRNIQIRPIWKLIHTLPMYKDFQTYHISNVEEVYESCFNLPCSVSLKESQIKYIVESIKEFCNR
jgi:perosamine synthetase